MAGRSRTVKRRLYRNHGPSTGIPERIPGSENLGGQPSVFTI